MTRTAIVSDIHGNLAALEAVLDDISKQNVDRIVCLGDVIGYGPAPSQCIDAAMKFEFCILGNHDSSALFDPEGFNVAAEQAIFWTRAQIECNQDGPDAGRERMKFICGLPRMVDEGGALFVHGSPRGPTNEYVFPEDTQNVKKMEKLFSMVPRICFQGHTHVPGVFTQDLRFVRPSETGSGYEMQKDGQRMMVNVGSVGQPRDGDPRSCYVVYDESVIEFRRVQYDIERTVREINAQPDLDEYLGQRLREGR